MLEPKKTFTENKLSVQMKWIKRYARKKKEYDGNQYNIFKIVLLIYKCLLTYSGSNILTLMEHYSIKTNIILYY